MSAAAPKRLLVVAHAPSPNTARLRDAVLEGARHPDVEGVTTQWRAPLETGPEAVRAADALILGTTENLGYMSGALKDFFDRIYYPVLEDKQGLPFALYIRAGHDGTGTRRAIQGITTGLRWRAVHDTVTLRGAWEEGFVDQCRALGQFMSIGLDAAVF